MLGEKVSIVCWAFQSEWAWEVFLQERNKVNKLGKKNDMEQRIRALQLLDSPKHSSQGQTPFVSISKIFKRYQNIL